MTKRRYTDDERAASLAALAANGGNIAKTATQVGVPETTLRQWASGKRHPESAQMSDQKKKTLADAFEGIAWKLLGVAQRNAGKLDAQKAMVAAAIAVDKMRLLRDEPTSINAHQPGLKERINDAERKYADAIRRAIAADGHSGTNGATESVHSARTDDETG